MAEKWIGKMNGGKGPKKNALHEEMGIPPGQKIPEKKLEAAEKKPGIEGKRARLAETFKGMNHGGSGSPIDRFRGG